MTLFFGFEGRINRRSFWLAALGLALFTALGIVAVVFLVFAISKMSPTGRINAPALFVLLIGYLVLVAWSWSAVILKRLHDLEEADRATYDEAWERDRIQSDLESQTEETAMFFALGFAPGAAGPNRHGPPPPNA